MRQALSLDESRRMFSLRIYEQADGVFDTAFGDCDSVQQWWFRGTHAGHRAIDQPSAATSRLRIIPQPSIVRTMSPCWLRVS